MDRQRDRDDWTGLRSGALSPRLFLGLAIMGVGLLLTLDNLGLVSSRDIWRYWPALLIVGGLLRMGEFFRCPGRAGVPWGLGLVIVGALLLLANMGLLHLRQVWPLFLLLLGASMVWRSFGGRGDVGPAKVEDASGSLSVFSLMGGVRRGTNTQDFQRGDAFAMMGGCEIDLTQAVMRGETAVFDVFAMMGGIVIRVPESWAVENRGLALLGGFEDKTRRPPEPSKVLVLRGFAMMGGIEVKN
jgi:hypothetical protein